MKKAFVFFIVLCMVISLPLSAFGDNELVDVTLGPPLFGDTTEEEAAEVFEDMGIDTYTINDDGTVSFSVSSEKLEETKKELMDEVEEMLQETIEDSGGIVVRIEHNDDLTSFDVFTRDEWMISFAAPIYTYGFAIFSTIYQELNGVSQEDLTLVVSYINAENNDVILSQSTEEIFTEEFFSSQDSFREETEQDDRREAVITDNMVVESAGYRLQIVGVHPFIGSDNETYGAVECIFSNDNAQGTSVSDVAYFEAYQNDVCCYRSNRYLGNAFDWDTELIKVKNGASITAFSAIPLFNDTDPIELEITLWDNQGNEIERAVFLVELELET